MNSLLMERRIIMEIIKRYGILILSTILTIAGYFKLKTSVSGGVEGANNYLATTGGTMDSVQFNMIQQGYIATNIVIGGALLVIGLGFLCLSYFKGNQS